MTTTGRQHAIRVAVTGLVLGAGLAFAGVPLNNLQGVGGVAFNPLAYPSGQNAKEEEKVEGGLHLALSRPQLGAWYVSLGDVGVDWVAGGVSETFFKRLELSYGYETISQDGADSINKQNFGAKVLLLPENYGDSAFVPAVSIGGLWKTTDADTGDNFDDAGWDAYVVATKLITQLPRPLLLSGGLLYTDELVTGVFGHDSDHDLTWFANIDVLASGVGTGGTITGVSRYIKQTRGKQILSVAVEPAESPIITQKRAGQELKPGPHKIQGIGAGFIPDTLDLSIVDRVEQVTSAEAVAYARRLALEEGILVGISCGAATAAAVRLAKLPEFAGKTFVVILPDSGERYLSTVLFEGVGG